MSLEVLYNHPAITERQKEDPAYKKLDKADRKVVGLLYGPDSLTKRVRSNFRLDTEGDQLVENAVRVSEIKRRLANSAWPLIKERKEKRSKEIEQSVMEEWGVKISNPDPKIRSVQQGVADSRIPSGILLKLPNTFPNGLPDSLKGALQYPIHGVTGFANAFDHFVTDKSQRTVVIEYYFNGHKDAKTYKHKYSKGSEGKTGEFIELRGPDIVTQMEKEISEQTEMSKQFEKNLPPSLR